MKKSILVFLVVTIATVGISQLINNTPNNNIKTETVLNSKENPEIIAQLDQEYYSRSETLNNLIKNNLIESITLNDDEIIINYQNLNPILYSESIYQTILSSEYLQHLNNQYELNLISFDKNSHINFENLKSFTYFGDIWMETHWYWFLWAKLHFNYNGIWKLINAVERVGENPASKASVITAFLFTQLPIVTVLAIALGIFLAASYFIIISYSNNSSGCWIGVLGVVPGVGWGGN